VKRRSCSCLKEIIKNDIWSASEMFELHFPSGTFGAIPYRMLLWVRFQSMNTGPGCTVVCWLAPSPHSKMVPGSNPGWGLSVWSLYVLSGYSGFLPPSKNMPVWLIGDSKLSLGVSVHGCESRLSLCGPVMDWRPVHGVRCLLPYDSCVRLQPPSNPELD